MSARGTSLDVAISASSVLEILSGCVKHKVGEANLAPVAPGMDHSRHERAGERSMEKLRGWPSMQLPGPLNGSALPLGAVLEYWPR